MEDLSRDMAKDLKRPNRRPKPETSKSWTFLLVGELGNIVSVRLSKTSLLCFVTLFVAVFSFSVIASVTYLGIRSQNKTLRDNLNAVTSELLSANKAMEGAQVRLMLLEGKGKPKSPQKKTQTKQKAEPGKKARPETKLIVAQKQQPEPTTKAKKKPPSRFVTAEAGKPPAATNVEEEASKPESEKPEEKPDSSSRTMVVSVAGQYDADDSVETVSEEALEVENLEIWKQAGQHSVRFQFSLKNVNATGKKMKGYTFVVLKPGEGSSEPPRGSPWTPLQDGQPSIFKRGQFFSIARFKYVRGKIPEIQDVERFKTATIFVYTESGNLLIEKVFDVADILRS
jgi:hypothetical protein